MKLKSLPLLLVLAAAVTACQKEVPAPAAAPAPMDAGTAGAGPTGTGNQVTDEVVWDESDAPVAGTRISISPDPVPFCDAAQQVVEVEWDLVAAESKYLQLWIEEKNGKRKLWVETKTLAGAKRTGNWATAGTRFVAVDPRDSRVLNSVTIQPAPCD